MKVNDFLKQVAYKKLLTLDDPMNCSFGDDRREYEVWLSKFDNSYITQVGMESNVDFLTEREITNELTHGVGFSPKDNKWYGWSHRAIYGFQIGSTCEVGDCHYRPKDKEDFLKYMTQFWDDESNLNTKSEHTTKNGEAGVYTSWKYGEQIPNEKLHGTITGIFTLYPDEYGRGEWTAQTMADAKQMAIDFNEGVS